MKTVIKTLIDEGLSYLAESYGEQGRHPLRYHNTEHAHDVMSAVEQLAQAAFYGNRIERGDIELLVLAACYHDIIHDRTDGSNEQASADFLAEKMRLSGEFTQEQIDLCTAAILATRYTLEDGRFGQMVTDDYATRLLADADLASLGRSFKTFWDRSLKLKAEHNDNAGLHAFVTNQLVYLGSHHFNTPEAVELFPHKKGNMTRLQAMLDRAV